MAIAMFRQIAEALQDIPSDQTLHVLIDGDGTFSYQYVGFRTLENPDEAHLAMDLLLRRREDVRSRQGRKP